jgi:hypothetical protein
MSDSPSDGAELVRGEGLPPAGRRRSGVSALALVLAALLLPLALMFSETTEGDHSSGAQGPDGTAALSGVLERMGLPVVRLGVGLLPLRFEQPGSVLFMPIAERGYAASHLSSAELEMLGRFVKLGSSLVLLANHETNALSAFGLKLEPEGRPLLPVRDRDPEGEQAAPVFLRPESLAGPLRVEGEAWLIPSEGDEILFGVGSYPIAAQRRVGKGRVLLVTDPGTVSNLGLSRGANLEFYVGFVERWLAGQGRVLFDDLHAGGASQRGLVAYARRAGLLPMLLLLGLLVVLYLWRGSARFGVVHGTADALVGRAETERIHATARLYERANLYRHGLMLSARRWRRVLEARSGKVWEGEQLGAWVEQEWGEEAGLQFEHIVVELKALQAQESPDPKACRGVVRAIHGFEESHLQRRVPRDRQ